MEWGRGLFDAVLHAAKTDTDKTKTSKAKIHIFFIITHYNENGGEIVGL
jgi:hypothetical protein